MIKFYVYIIGIFALLLTSCGGEQNKKFNPKERTSSMSDSDRQAAIAAKRQALLPVDIDSLIASHGVKFSVVPPAITEEVPESASEKLTSKLILIASQNGIGGLCTNPVLAMVSRVDCVQRELTGTAPQKAVVKFEVTIYCGNTLTEDVYASTVQTLTGVGSSFEEATNQAFNELKNDSKTQQMLQNASEKALKWYNETGNVQAFVDKALAEQNYALASALLSSVPQESSSFAYAIKKNEEVSDMMFQEKADALLASMRNAIVEGGDSAYNPQVGAFLELIPPRSKAYAQAKQAYDAYLAKLDATVKDKRDKEHEKVLQELELKKIKAPLEAQAAMEEMKTSASLKNNEIWSNALSNIATSVAQVFLKTDIF